MGGLIFWGVCFLLLAGAVGCGSVQGQTGIQPELSRVWGQEGKMEDKEMEEIGKLYQRICGEELYGNKVYGGKIDSEKIGTEENMRRLIAELGMLGYSAVDSENQIDMAGAGQVEEFCWEVEAGNNTELTLLKVARDGGLTRYNCQSVEEGILIREGYYVYREGKLEERNQTIYRADFWEYTDGYLFFGRNYMPGYDGSTEHTALRVEPLKETYREWNRKYLLPTGYGNNNLFWQNWSETDLDGVDVSDLFDAWYQEKQKQPSPYLASENLSEGAVYRITAEEFEGVVGLHLSVSVEALRARGKYIPEEGVYEYRPRGLYDCIQPDCPYPEVVDGRENEDGTLTLIVRAVDPKENQAYAFMHEVVVLPLEDGGFQYVSNRLLSEETLEAYWYRERLTEEEWREFYGSSV